jgi:hypothetical protein
VTVLAMPANGRPSASVERVLARLVDPQSEGLHRWRGACPVHGAGCTFTIRQARDGSARLECTARGRFGEFLEALQLTRDEVGPPVTLTAETRDAIARETAKIERELVAAALDRPEDVLQQLAARGFDPAVLPTPVLRAILGELLRFHREDLGADTLLLADAVATTGVCDASTAKTEIGLLIARGYEVAEIDTRVRYLEDAHTRRVLAGRLERARNLALDSQLAPLEMLDAARDEIDEAALRLGATVQAEAPTLRELLADPAMLVEPVVVVPRLAWKGRATLLSGPEKAGKSSYLGAAAAAVSRGDAFLDEGVTRGLVLWFALDEPKPDTVQRLVRHEADLDHVRICDRIPQGHADVGRLVTQLRPTLTIIDTLGTYAAPMVESMNDRSQMLRALTPLMHLVRDSDTALVLVHHDKKAGGYSDSQAIGGAVDVIQQWTDPKAAGDRTRRDVAVQGRVRLYDYAVRLDGLGYLPVDRREITLDAKILEYLNAHPLASTNAVETAVGGTNQKVRDELRKLWERGAILDEHGGGTKHKAWRLVRPGEAPQAVPGARVYHRRPA